MIKQPFNRTKTNNSIGILEHLTRRGPTGTEPGLFPGSVNTVYGAVDSLVIALDGNRLLKVDDLADDSYSEPSMDFFDGDDQPVEYTYDANGNLTSDLNKGITSITYNAVDRPETVTFDDGHQIRFTWDATGRKLAASYLVDRRTTLSPVAGIESDSLGSHGAADLSTMLTRHYCGEHIYADNQLERTITPVGYIDGTSGCHYAYIRDHQGNNRATLSADGWHTSVMKYYPFGAATWHGDQADRYRFGGKELDRTLGLDLYDFEARMYDPVLARFCQPDPMAWKYTWLSPYAYCVNNPIRYIDPSGMIFQCLDEQAKSNILFSLSPDDAKFVTFNDNGIIDSFHMNERISTSSNFNALLSLVNSDILYTYQVSDNDGENASFYGNACNSERLNDYYYGVTMMPNAKSKPSADSNVHIYTASFLDQKSQIKNAAHEVYGHAYFYELSLHDPSIDPQHTHGIIRFVYEYDDIAKQIIPIPVFGLTNLVLELQIKRSVREALQNYEQYE